MHSSRTLILLLAGLGLVSPAPSPNPKIDPSPKLTDYSAIIDLAHFEESADGIFDGALEKRLNVDVCNAVATSVGMYFEELENRNRITDASFLVACAGVAALVYQVATGIAGSLKGNSDAKDCTAHHGAADGVTWRVYATGANCDTTAQLSTIQGAVTDYLEQQNRQVCGVHCLKLSHGGTWTGYVTIAKEGTPLDSYYCGASNSFGNCSSGGENDL